MGCEMWDCGLRIADCGLRIADLGMWIWGCGFGDVGWRMWELSRQLENFKFYTLTFDYQRN